MKDLARWFCVPVTQTRPKGARLQEGYSPKLKRRVQLFDYSSFPIWIRLEADPKVVAFCERPAPIGSPGNDALIDFWIRLADGEECFWIISSDDAPDLPITLRDHAVQKWLRNFEQRYKWKLWAKSLAEVGSARRSFRSSRNQHDVPVAPTRPRLRRA